MTRPDPDWGFLRQGMLLPALCLLAGTLLWTTTTIHRTRLDNALEAERQALAGIEQERQELISRREAREKFSAVYRQLTASGIVGPDQRLQWVQALRSSTSSLGLPYVRYSTGPQEVFTAPYLMAGISAPVMSSPMELQLGLVHELDLLRLLDKLAASPGLFHVRGCELERLESSTPAESGRANLSGSCQLSWFSIPAGSSLAAANNGE
ncbi:MAG: hypothetical protein QG595_717 [Pseudomonadota bacterium]|jgi:hypothetical protein|nr:hypothetical protein [Pseudomonadota bacterium]